MFSQLTKQPIESQELHSTDLMVEIGSFLTGVIEDPVSYLLIPVGRMIFIIVLTFVFLRLLNRVTDHLFSLSRIESKKANTLRALTKSVLRYAVYFIAILIILINLGFNPMPILAGAGILGLAIGFGAQNLVRDVITGFFLIFERQLEVGDLIEINGKINGTVEEVGLRVTKIREFNQRLHYLANGSITQVTNYNRERMRAIVTITVPYESNLDQVHLALGEACEKISEIYTDSIVEHPQVLGITNLDSLGVQFMITALSKPESYNALEREIRKEAVQSLLHHGIEISYPRTINYKPYEVYELQTGQELTGYPSKKPLSESQPSS